MRLDGVTGSGSVTLLEPHIHYFYHLPDNRSFLLLFSVLSSFPPFLIIQRSHYVFNLHLIFCDIGQNFGAGFYNDHHFHYGYHIYAAAVLAKLSPDWARLYHERVLVLIRDIANPSSADPFFTTFRHKDWYLGSSWASGIVTIQGMLELHYI